ncbi:aldose 1-epimerase family protein [Paenibacillus sp. J5C_2022]|uniref:aldose 1-epimerase family protein n=1 Tax=Paenibacillus sp. J5C2022 TaxID=2977129 RepID=UPI0021D1B45C|nr:aldose 1-epimerase family protein [Paenibacillus sp. J5C2022]MCU6707871.1 aldose 1-epimerase family protein [Paenibacillus sp. J5C2022]
MQLYGRQWNRRELEARVGRIEQLGGVERYAFSEGPEKGMDAFRVRTGSGLSYWITPDKGMDISLAEMYGVPVSWSSGNGEPHPAYYNPSGAEWLRTASGGLLMTCGLTQAGAPGSDEWGNYGLHGRIHHTPARQISSTAEWLGDEYEMRISGVIEETSIFGERLRLTRSIASRLGDNRIIISDKVENAGFRPAPHMMLYHFNFGFPLLAEDTMIELPEGRTVPRDPDMDMERMNEWQIPDAAWREQVYHHEPYEKTNKICARIHSPSFPASAASGAGGLTVELQWDPSVLPRIVQWRMPGASEHVLGLEPSNCWTQGRSHEQHNGTLRILEPGEAIDYKLELRFGSQPIQGG